MISTHVFRVALQDEPAILREIEIGSDKKLVDLAQAIVRAFDFQFDHGDEWRFMVEVIGRGEREPKVRYPRVLKKVGASPEQYPDWDDDAEEYQNEEDEDEPRRPN